MGFFKDFKRDFAQAVNELMPDKDELTEEYDDEDMVNTFDDVDIAPEDMLQNIDSMDEEDDFEENEVALRPEDDYDDYEDDDDDDDESNDDDGFDNIPEAEVIAGTEEPDADDLMDISESESAVVEEILEAESVETRKYSDKKQDTEAEAAEETEESDENIDKEDTVESSEDELKQLVGLDEEDMLENVQDALETEYQEEGDVNPDPESNETTGSALDEDIDKAVLDAMKKDDVEVKEEPEVVPAEEDIMADVVENDKTSEIEGLTEEITYITKGTVIKGSLSTDGSVDIIGTVEGDVLCQGKLILGGTIKGNVEAGEIYANAAKIEGEIKSEGSVKIGVGTVVVGNVSATSAVIAGAVNGDIDVQGPVIVDSTAVIMGNIKSRSVQINNGAVIEGFCSQCYSEIDVKSFFD